jgi:alpha/beta superfamily hydrolase
LTAGPQSAPPTARKIQERAIVVARADGRALEGLYHAGEVPPAIVIAPPHPRLGGSMDSPVVAEIAFAAARDGRPTLRFNFSGVAGSQGEIDGTDGSTEAVDYAAAWAELGATAPGAPAAVAAGYSFGAVIAARHAAARASDAHALLLVAPPTRLLALPSLVELAIPVLVVYGIDDGYVERGAVEALVPPQARIEVLRADHFFQRGLAELGRLVTEWLRTL